MYKIEFSAYPKGGKPKSGGGGPPKETLIMNFTFGVTVFSLTSFC